MIIDVFSTFKIKIKKVLSSSKIYLATICLDLMAKIPLSFIAYY